MKNRSFIVVLVVYFFISIGNNLIHSITTPFIQDFLKIDSVYFGIYFSMMSLGQVIGSILCGFLSRRIKLKKLLVIGMFGYAFFQLMFGFMNFNPNIVIAWRLLSGLFIVFPNTLILVFALKYVNNENRIKSLSLLSSVSILGVAVGYEIAGLLHDYVFFDNYYLSFVVQFSWCSFVGVFIMFFVKDVEIESENKSANYFGVLKNMSLCKKLFFIAFLFSSLATIIVSKFFEPFFQNIGNQMFSSSDLAHIVLLTSLIGIVANLLIIPFIKNKKDLKANYIFMFLVFLSGLLVFTIFSQRDDRILIVFIFSLYFVYSMVRYLIVPVEQNITVKNVGEDDMPSYISFRQALLSLSQVLGPLLMTELFSYNMRFPFFIASILFILSSIIMFFSCRFENR